MLIGLISVSIIAVFLFIRAFKLSVANLELSELVLQQYKEIDANSDAVKENFLKFISDSREWAFDYIEEVQNALNKFVSEVDPLIKYFDNYGDVLSNSRPDYNTLKQISTSFKELKKILPEEINK